MWQFDYVAGHHPRLAGQLPTDPRARKVLHNLQTDGGKPGLLARILARRRPVRESSAWLYSMIRFARPDDLLIIGIPPAEQLILIAAAAADAGGRRVVCLAPCARPSLQVIRLVSIAGLDWLLRFSSRLPAGFRQADLVVLSRPDRLSTQQLGPIETVIGQADLVIGLGDSTPSDPSGHESAKACLQQLGFGRARLLAPDSTFWAMANKVAGRA